MSGRRHYYLKRNRKSFANMLEKVTIPPKVATRLKNYYEFGEFRLEYEKLRLWRGDDLIHLRPKALEILLLLIENRPRTVLRDEILEAVWNETYIEEGNINFNISVLRKAISCEAWPKGNQIVTVPKEGYRFVADIQHVTDDGVQKGAADRATNATERMLSDPAQPRPRSSVRYYIGLVVLAFLFITSFGLWRSTEAEVGNSVPIAGRRIKSIAILPPTSIENDTDSKVLSRGIADQLISRLGSIDRFVVRPFTAVEDFEAKGVSSLEFGRKLKVDAVLEGSLQSDGNRLRVVLRLFDVRDNLQLWTQTFEENNGDIFRMQDVISAGISEALSLQFGRDGNASFAERYTQNEEAYRSYLRGRMFFDKRTPENFSKATVEFENAIALDPGFALAYSGLSDVYSFVTVHEKPRFITLQNARQAAQKALELDERLAEAHTSLAWIYRQQDWNWEASERHFKRAIEINPNYVNARQWYALLLVTLGRLDEANVEIDKAREIDPLSIAVNQNYIATLIFTRRYAEIVRTLGEIEKLHDDSSVNLRIRAVAYDRTGDTVKTMEIVEELFRRNNNRNNTGGKALDARLAVIYDRMGRKEESQRLLNSLEKKILPEDAYAAYHLAMAYADLGRNDDALKMLETCLGYSDQRLLWIKVEPKFDPLRGEQRFQAILKKMRLE